MRDRAHSFDEASEHPEGSRAFPDVPGRRLNHISVKHLRGQVLRLGLFHLAIGLRRKRHSCVTDSATVLGGWSFLLHSRVHDVKVAGACRATRFDAAGTDHRRHPFRPLRGGHRLPARRGPFTGSCNRTQWKRLSVAHLVTAEHQLRPIDSARRLPCSGFSLVADGTTAAPVVSRSITGNGTGFLLRREGGLGATVTATAC